MGELTTIKELETPIKLTPFLLMKDFAFIIIYAFVSNELLTEFIYSGLHTIYTINCIIWGIYFILPAYGNSRRRNWQNILNTLINVHVGTTYYSVKREVEDNDIR